jgi:hypothetical protein
MQRIIIIAACVMLLLYAGGYAAYCQWGPCVLTYPHGEDNPAPSLVASCESPGRTFLCNLFTPCMWVEDYYWAWRSK